MIRTFFLMSSAVALVFGASSCMSRLPSETDAAKALELPAIGSKIPNDDVHRTDGAEVDIHDIIMGQHSILVFYRGGWCPYCMKHLQELATVEKELTDMGWKLYAISPDRPEVLRQTMAKEKPLLTLLSDSDLDLAEELGLVFKVDDDTVLKYEGYGIDLEAASGMDHHRLPVPAVFLVKPDGTIAWQYADPDYRERLNGQELLQAARKVMQ